MRRALVPLLLVIAGATASAEKSRTVAKGLSGGGAAVSGAVVLAGFLTAPESKPFNVPVLYTGVGMLFVTPSLGHFYAEQYLTLGMGIRAVAAGIAVYALKTQTRLATCDTAHSSNEPPCEILSENAYPLLGVAAIAFIGGVWWDNLDAGDAVDRYNSSHGFTIAPSVQTTAQSWSAGISGTF